MSDDLQQPGQSEALGPSSPATKVALGIALALVTVLYWDLFHWWLEAWTNPGYYCTHGPLIPLVSAYLVWDRLRGNAPTEGPPARGSGSRDAGMAILLLAGLLRLLSQHLDLKAGSGVSFVVLCWGLVWFLWGKQWALRLLLPIGFLLFMIPVPFLANALTLPLQQAATSVSAMVGGLLGFPVTARGLMIHLPNYAMEIAPPCSGVNSLFSVVPLAVLVAAHQPLDGWKRTLLVLSSIPLALAANCCRILLTLLLAWTCGPAFAEGFLHSLSGLLLFACTVAGLYAVARGLRTSAQDTETGGLPCPC